MADRPLRLPPSSDSKPSKKNTLKERARNALITGTAGGYLGGMLVEGKARVKIPAITRKLLKLGRRKTIGIHGARTGALAGALIGARNRGKRSETADAVATGGDWKFQKPPSTTVNHRQQPPTSFSAFIEDMTFGSLPKDVQTEVLRFVDAKKGTPVVHYGMTVTELVMKADGENLKAARKAQGTTRASRAREEVMGKIKAGSKYILLMNDRIVDGHHFLAKAERGAVTSSLNVLDLTPARLSTGKVTEFGILGAKGNHKRPTILKGVPNLPPGMAAYQAPAGVRATNKLLIKGGHPADWRDNSKARKVGRILESGQPVPELVTKSSGYGSEKDMHKSLRRHELVHSIQSSKRGYRVHGRLRDLVKDEVGAYATMNRRVKGGSKVLRAANAITGVPLSIGLGIAGNKKLQKRALLRGAQGAALAGGAVAAKKLTEKRELETRFAEAEPRRNRTRDLRDKIGLAKDVAGLGVTVGAGVGAHKLYKSGRQVLRKAGPQFGAAAKAWHKAALKTGKTLDTVKDAVAPAAGVNRGVASVGRKIVQGARKVAAFLHSDPRPVLAFSEERKAKWNAALLGAAAPVAAGGLVLGTRGGRNALRGLLSKVDKGDPRRLRRVVLNQKRKDASVKRNAAKAVGKAREQFRAEALPKAPKEPGLKDAVKTVRQRAKRKIVNAVANIGANPAEVKFEAAQNPKQDPKYLKQVKSRLRAAGLMPGRQRFTPVRGAVPLIKKFATQFEAPRDKLSKARDAALLTAGVAGTGAVVYGAHKLRGLKSSPTIRKGKAIAENVRNATSITADAGRIYNHLKDPIVRPKRVIAGVRRGWKQGMKEGMSQPAPAWKKGVVKIGKKLRLLESASPSLRFSKSPHLQSFAIGGLVGSGIGTLIGSQIGERFKHKTRNALKKWLIPKLGQKWGRRVARAGQFVPENAGAIAGGVIGSIAGGGIRRKASSEFQVSGFKLRQFGGNDQLQDLNSGGFARPLDVFVGRKRGYKRTDVKDYHEARRALEKHANKQVKLKPETVAALKGKMQRIRDNPEHATGGQVLRSAMREGDKIQRWAGRGKGLAKDAVAHLRGDAREKDAWGRSKKREWEKGWFQRTKDSALAGGALLGGYALLKRKPKVRAKIDRAGRQVVRAVNSQVGDLMPRADKHWKTRPLTPGGGMGKFRVTGAKPAAMAPRTKKGRAAAKLVKAQVAAAEVAAKTAGAADRAKAAKKVKVVKPFGGTPPLKGLSRLHGALLQFNDPLDQGWDLRDARGRSARVFAPGSNQRDRRPKKWHEKIDNERKLWGAAALAGTASGAAAVRKIVKRGADKEIKRRVAQIGAAVRKNYVPKSKPSAPTNIHAFKPMKPGTAA